MSPREPNADPCPPWARLALAVALVALVFFGFAPALQAGFVGWDDQSHIVEVPQFRGLEPENLRWMFTTAHMGPYQPLAWLSFAVDHALWGLDAGLDAPQARAFHRTSLVIHALGALLLWRLAARLFSRGFARGGTSVELAAALAAAVYAAHPLRVESVAWATERRDVLCALFYVAAAYAWLRALGEAPARRAPRARDLVVAAVPAALAVAAFRASIDWSVASELTLAGLGASGIALALALVAASAVLAARSLGLGRARAGWYALSLAAFSCALLSKGLAFVLPFVLLVADAWPLGRMRSASGKPAVAPWLDKAPFLALSAIAAMLATWGQGSLPEAVVSLEAHSIRERIVQAFHGLAFYPAKTFVPLGLSAMVELPDDVRTSDPRFALAIGAVVVVAAAAWFLRRRLPALPATLGAFALAIAPVLGFTQTGPQLVADRYSLLACLPFALLAGAAWLAWRERAFTQRSAALLAALVAVGALAYATRRQTRTWHDSETLWARVLEVDPDSAIAHGQVATLRMQASEQADVTRRRELLEEALRLFQRERELDATPIANDLLNHGTVLLRLNRAGEAEPILRQSVAARPAYFLGHATLGAALAAQRKTPEALAAARRAVELKPDYARGWYQLGMIQSDAGERAEAIESLEKTVALWPSFEPARRKLAELRSQP